MTQEGKEDVEGPSAATPSAIASSDIPVANDNEPRGIVARLKNDLSYRARFQRTVWICLSFTMLGWIEALSGPALPDLRQIIDVDLETASWLFTAASAGYLTGSIISWFIYDRFNKTVLMTASIVGTATATAGIPWCLSLPAMLAVRVVGGAFSASLDTGGNAEVASMWGTEGGPYMQALHFCFSLGGFISPLVAEPFLARRSCQGSPGTTAVPFMNRSSSTVAAVQPTVGDTYSVVQENNSTSLCTEVYGQTKVQYAYLLSGVLMILTALPFCFALLGTSNHGNKKNVATKEEADRYNFQYLPLHVKIAFWMLLSSLMFFYCATEDTHAGFLMTFSLTQLKWSKSEGSLATAVHWASFGAARLVAIVIVRYVKTVTLMFCCSVLLILSFVALLIVTLLDVTALVWVFIAMVGVSMSVIFPSIFTWTTERITPVSGKLSAMFMTASSLGIMLCPPLFGYTMEELSPMWFLYLLVGLSVTWVLLFSLTFTLTNVFLKARPVKAEHVAQEDMLLSVAQ